MANIPPSATTSVWPRDSGSVPFNSGSRPFGGGPVPLGVGPTGFPMGGSPNFPPTLSTSTGTPPPVPRPPLTPFPSLRPQFGPATSLTSNYATPAVASPFNPNPINLVPNYNAQNEITSRRIAQLEDENLQRRNTTADLTQMGVQLLHGQMDVQEQVLQYQFMLEQCMDSLDHQNLALNQQQEEVMLLRSKMRHLEYLMDALKHSREGSQLLRSMSHDLTGAMNANALYCCDPLTLPAPSTSPFFAGGATRATPSTFQPFNPRYRSPTSRAEAASTLSGRTSAVPSARVQASRR